MFRDVVTLHRSTWIALNRKPDRLTIEMGYTRPVAYFIALISTYSLFVYYRIGRYFKERETQIFEY